MSIDVDGIRKYAHISPEEENLLISPQRPIILLRKNEPNPIAEQVSQESKHRRKAALYAIALSTV